MTNLKITIEFTPSQEMIDLYSSLFAGGGVAPVVNISTTTKADAGAGEDALAAAEAEAKKAAAATKRAKTMADKKAAKEAAEAEAAEAEADDDDDDGLGDDGLGDDDDDFGDDVPAPTLGDVRKAMRAKADADGKPAALKILSDLGASSLGELKEEDYAAAIAAAE